MLFRSVLGLDAPTCGLLAIGEEPGKGDARMKEAHALLADDATLAYRGSVEGRDALTSLVDVIVADGFAGNVVLKACEGTAREAFRRVRAEATGPRAAPMWLTRMMAPPGFTTRESSSRRRRGSGTTVNT